MGRGGEGGRREIDIRMERKKGGKEGKVEGLEGGREG